jgi:hypothetical protein
METKGAVVSDRRGEREREKGRKRKRERERERVRLWGHCLIYISDAQRARAKNYHPRTLEKIFCCVKCPAYQPMTPLTNWNSQRTMNGGTLNPKP